MKKLNDFMNFNIDAFLDGKKLILTGLREWTDFETKEVLGTKLDVVIAEDRTKYSEGKDGEIVNNLFEKFTVKVPKTIKLPQNTEIKLVQPYGVVYGDYRNQLSVTASDVKANGKSTVAEA